VQLAALSADQVSVVELPTVIVSLAAVKEGVAAGSVSSTVWACTNPKPSL
jgi:hypothetical protein